MNDISKLSEIMYINKLGKIVDAVMEKNGITDYENKADNTYIQQFIELADVLLGKEGTTIEAINEGTADMEKVPTTVIDCLEAIRCAILGKEWNSNKYLADCLVTPSVSTDCLGKTVGELTTNLKIENGKVFGKLNYIYGYKGFSSIEDEQDGYYLPINFEPSEEVTEAYMGVVVANREVRKEPVKLDDLGILYLGKTPQEVADREVVISAVRADGVEEIIYIDLTSIGLGQKKVSLSKVVKANKTISPSTISKENTLTDLIASCKEENVVIDFTKNVYINETVTIPEGKVVTMNLNGTVINNIDGGDTETIVNNGTLIINDKTRASIIENDASGKSAILNNGNLTIGGVKVKRTLKEGDNSYYTIANRGTMVINNGTYLLPDGGNASLIQNGWYDGNENTEKVNAVLTINGGTFDGGLNTVKNDDWGIMTINGGNFTNQTQAVVWNVNECKINGGIFKSSSEAKYCLVNWYLNDEFDKGILEVNDGTFFATGDDTVVLWNKASASKTTIKGGNFIYINDEFIKKEAEESVIEISASLTTEPIFASEVDEKYIKEGYIVVPTEEGYVVVAE